MVFAWDQTVSLTGIHLPPNMSIAACTLQIAQAPSKIAAIPIYCRYLVIHHTFFSRFIYRHYPIGQLGKFWCTISVIGISSHPNDFFFNVWCMIWTSLWFVFINVKVASFKFKLFCGLWFRRIGLLNNCGSDSCNLLPILVQNGTKLICFHLTFRNIFAIYFKGFGNFVSQFRLEIYVLFDSRSQMFKTDLV